MIARYNIPGYFLMLIGSLTLVSCYSEDALNVPENEVNEPVTELDIYIQEHYTEEYNIAIRYKYVESYVEPGKRVSPPRLEAVRPMLDFIDEYWIQPYKEVENGEVFFRRYVPKELVFLGGLIYNGDGTVTLGTADAGARITFTNVNEIDPTDSLWRALQLHVTYHEFAHTVHQEFKLPAGFENITPSGYTGPGSWFVLTEEEALIRGFVSPYATSNANEDFAENVSFYLFDSGFFDKYIDHELCDNGPCEVRNLGRDKISDKLVTIKEHYSKVTGINLDALRDVIQLKLTTDVE